VLRPLTAGGPFHPEPSALLKQIVADVEAHLIWTDTRDGVPTVFTSNIDETLAAGATSTPLGGSSTGTS
jgi:hypothetical protein